jgi:hypothetical protein
MAGDRTLKLSLLADTKNLVDGLSKGGKATESFGKQIGDISEKAVKAFALIGGAIAGVSIAFAKAAAEDEAAANKLNATISSVTTATESQIKAVENYITTTAIATGITDDNLRPAFERLVRSTKDVDEATKLMNLSLDLSAATGKPLEAVTNALARAYDGSYTSLNKLGLGLDANLIKSKDFNAIYETLNTTFGEFSEQRSEEAIVKFQRLQVALDEAKEAVGAALLPAFEKFGDWLINDGVPRLNAFIAGLVGDESLSSSFSVAQKKSEEFGEKVRSVIDTVIKYKDALITAAAVTATVFVVSKIAAGVTATIALIKSLIVAYNALKASAIVAGVAQAFALNPLLGVGAAALAAGVLSAANALANKYNTDTSGLGANTGSTGSNTVGAGGLPFGNTAGSGSSGGSGAGLGLGSLGGVITGGGSSSGGGIKIKPAPTLIETVTQENFIKNMAPGNFDPGRFRQADNNISITVNGAVDPVGTARQIATILNTEASTAGSFTNLGVSRFATRAE